MILPYGNQWIDEKDIDAVVEVLKSDWITQGPKVKEFEKKVAKYCGAKYAVAVSSGTAALHTAYSVAGIKKGDEVITSPLSFAATANAVVYCGGRPVFTDIQEDSLNIDPEQIEKKITEKTKAIAPVDFAGQVCDLDTINTIAKKHNLLVIEDGAHSLGSEYKGRKIGSIADMTVFSFHPVKIITTGEGGMITTDNQEFYNKLNIFRHHGIVKNLKKGGWYYEIQNPGYNLRLTDLQSALGVSQLGKIEWFIKRRREIVDKYNQELKDVEEIILSKENDYSKSAWHIYVIQLKLNKLKVDRKAIFDEFHKQGIGAQVHYMPIHLHPFYKEKFGYEVGDFPIAENYYNRAITIPLFPKMSNQDVEKVIETVRRIINSFKK